MKLKKLFGVSFSQKTIEKYIDKRGRIKVVIEKNGVVVTNETFRKQEDYDAWLNLKSNETNSVKAISLLTILQSI